MTAYANVDGHTCIEAVLHVPNVGPWWADVVFEGAPEVSGAVVFALGDLQLHGTVDLSADGTFGEQRRSRIVAGGGGWATLVTAQHYHSEAGVRALGVAQDAARLAGETLGTFAPAVDSIGADYTREAGLASRVLEDVIGGTPWHVDYSGQTIVGTRATAEADAADYQVLDFNPRENLVTLAIDDLETVGIGSILSEGLDNPLTVRELEVRVSVDASRTTAWGGGTAAGRGRLAGLVEGVVRAVTDDRLPYKYRYRVIRMATNRVELQAVALTAGLPDVLPVSMRPGVAGAHAKLVAGSRVLVEFIEGDRTMPVIVGFAGKDDTGHAADELDFSVTTSLRLGGASASEGVTLGTTHKSWADAHKHSYIDSVASGVGVTSTPTPTLTTEPAIASGPPPTGLPITPDPAPATSTKVFAE